MAKHYDGCEQRTVEEQEAHVKRQQELTLEVLDLCIQAHANDIGVILSALEDDGTVSKDSIEAIDFVSSATVGNIRFIELRKESCEDPECKEQHLAVLFTDDMTSEFEDLDDKNMYLANIPTRNVITRIVQERKNKKGLH